MEGWRLVEEGVCGPEDIDTVMTGGLGLRWSFIGPFETAHLNAPDGTLIRALLASSVESTSSVEKLKM